jgi:hypothetical protein
LVAPRSAQGVLTVTAIATQAPAPLGGRPPGPGPGPAHSPSVAHKAPVGTAQRLGRGMGRGRGEGGSLRQGWGPAPWCRAQCLALAPTAPPCPCKPRPGSRCRAWARQRRLCGLPCTCWACLWTTTTWCVAGCMGGLGWLGVSVLWQGTLLDGWLGVGVGACGRDEGRGGPSGVVGKASLPPPLHPP